MIDTEILEDYGSEARELLDEMDHNLIRLEKEGSSPELLNNIFRAVHCIKGSAEYIGLERSSTLTHGIENLLDRLREGAAALTPPIVDFLFRAKDLISTLVSEVSQHHAERSEISGVMEELDRFLMQAPDDGLADKSLTASSLASQVVETGFLASESASEEVVPADGASSIPDEAQEVISEAEQDAATTATRPEDTIPEKLSADEYAFRPEPFQDAEPTLADVFDQSESNDTTVVPTEEEAESPFGLTHLREGSLEETVSHVLSISLYLDDLQDGLNEEEALSFIMQKIGVLREHPSFSTRQDMLDILDSMEERLMAVAEGPATQYSENVEGLRGLLHALRPYYPPDLFPLDQKTGEDRQAYLMSGKGQPSEPPIPSAFAEELAQVPGITSPIADALVQAGYVSWDGIASADLASLTEVEGVSPSLARSLLHAAGVTPPVPKPVPVPVARPREDRSLLADVDDDLLKEFEGIFVPPEAREAEGKSDSAPSEIAADLLEELGSVGETDREIMEIFLSYGWEIVEKLRPLVRTMEESGAERSTLEKAADLIKHIRSSSTYMDYQGLASFLDQWYEKTLWAASRIESISRADLEFMNEYLQRFQQFLHGLERALNPASTFEPGASQAGEAPYELIAYSTRERSGARPEEVPSESSERFVGVAATTEHGEPAAERAEVPEAGEAPPAEAGAQVVPASDFGHDGALVKTMRVDSSKVDLLLNQVGELVVNRSYVEQLSFELKEFQRLLMTTKVVGKRELSVVKDLILKVGQVSLSLGRVSTDIQEGVMKLRMLPIGQLFNRMPRLIRDLSRRVGKVVNLEVYGGDTEVDKRVIEQIYNPLVHLIRNSVDHGIEDPETRKRLGKGEEGSVILRAYSEGNQVVIDVEDDGSGIDRRAVLRKAVESRLLDGQDLENISTQEVYNFLFLPGFSTSEKVTRTSGRGVGMDVVKKDVEKINGHVEIESWETRGTRISIKIPLTLAIIQTLLIRSGKHHFAIPLTSVREIVQVNRNDIQTIEGFEVIKFRHETIPVLRVSEIFKLEETREARFLVIATAGPKTIGFLVESLLGEQDVVIKPLAEHVCEIRGLAGSTILGDGTIALVMDVTEIVDDIMFQQRQLGIQGGPYARSESVAGIR